MPPAWLGLKLTNAHNRQLDRLAPEHDPNHMMLVEHTKKQGTKTYDLIGGRMKTVLLRAEARFGRTHNFAYVSVENVQAEQKVLPLNKVTKYLDDNWNALDIDELYQAFVISNTHDVIRKFAAFNDATLVDSEEMDDAYLEDYNQLLDKKNLRVRNAKKNGSLALKVPRDAVLLAFVQIHTEDDDNEEDD